MTSRPVPDPYVLPCHMYDSLNLLARTRSGFRHFALPHCTAQVLVPLVGILLYTCAGAPTHFP
eukprot:1181634-Amphidinium_carterae.1